MIHYLFNLICFQYRMLSIEYFMDSCTLWEIDNILDNLKFTDRNLWETTRLSTFIDAKSHFKNIKKYSDICEFEWEKENIEKESIEHDIEISSDDIKRLKDKAKKWQN